MQGSKEDENINIVAIDGPAGAGKSTIAKKLSKILGYSYLDTGAMYRALTYKALSNGLKLDNEEVLVEMAHDTLIDLEAGDNGVIVHLDGKDVSKEIRLIEVTNNTFYIARAPKVREIMVKLQRDIASKKSIVVEGRDVTTVVFPNAKYKFYLDADLNERAKRRLKELEEKGKKVDSEQLTCDLKERDHKDLTREVGALKVADDAVVIDSTFLSIEEVIAEILNYIKR